MRRWVMLTGSDGKWSPGVCHRGFVRRGFCHRNVFVWLFVQQVSPSSIDLLICCAELLEVVVYGSVRGLHVIYMIMGGRPRFLFASSHGCCPNSKDNALATQTERIWDCPMVLIVVDSPLGLCIAPSLEFGRLPPWMGWLVDSCFRAWNRNKRAQYLFGTEPSLARRELNFLVLLGSSIHVAFPHCNGYLSLFWQNMI